MNENQCKACQYSDQMMCECGLAWDVNDSEPPVCPRSDEARIERGRKWIERIKRLLVCVYPVAPIISIICQSCP